MIRERSEHQIWKAFKAGDKNAIAHIYKSNYEELYHYALKLTGNKEMTEDAIHDAFAYLWQNRQNLGEILSFKFYLLRSVRNQCLKLFQKQSRFRKLESVEESFQMIIQPEELKLTDTSEMVKRKMIKALGSLSNRQREIIYLKYYNNLDYEEIAELLGINYQSVVNTVHRAMQKLRKMSVLHYLRRF